MSTFGFIQHAKDPTHIAGHTLDVFIAPEDGILFEIKVNPPGIISDHSLMSCSLGFQKHKRVHS